MAGFTQAEAQAILDARFPTSGASDYLGYSENGTTETSILARTAIGATGWAAATAAQPSVKANDEAVTSGDATGVGTISHAAVFTASTSGTRRTDWQALDNARTLAVGDQLSLPVGAVQIALD